MTQAAVVIDRARLVHRLGRLSRHLAGTDEFEARGAWLIASVLMGRGEWGAAERMLCRAEYLLGWDHDG